MKKKKEPKRLASMLFGEVCSMMWGRKMTKAKLSFMQIISYWNFNIQNKSIQCIDCGSEDCRWRILKDVDTMVFVLVANS